MKIDILGDVDSTIVYEANRIAREEFRNIKTIVGLFQSTEHEKFKLTEKEKVTKASAVFVVKKDFDLESKVFPGIDEVKDFIEKKHSSIVLMGKIIKRDKDNRGPRHVVGHELKHAEQIKSDSKSFYKNNLLKFFLPNEEIPSEIDADNFANNICGRGNKKDYEENDWIRETDGLFNANLKNIETINQGIIENKEEIVIVIRKEEYVFDDVPRNINKRVLFQHYYQKTGF